MTKRTLDRLFWSLWFACMICFVMVDVLPQYEQLFMGAGTFLLGGSMGCLAAQPFVRRK